MQDMTEHYKQLYLQQCIKTAIAESQRDVLRHEVIELQAQRAHIDQQSQELLDEGFSGSNNELRKLMSAQYTTLITELNK